MPGAVRQGKVRHPLPDLRSVGGLGGNVPRAPEKSDGTGQEQETKRRGDASRDLSFVDPRLAEYLPQTDQNHSKAGQRQQKADPRDRRRRKTDERQSIAQRPERRQQQSHPWRKSVLSYC